MNVAPSTAAAFRGYARALSIVSAHNIWAIDVRVYAVCSINAGIINASLLGIVPAICASAIVALPYFIRSVNPNEHILRRDFHVGWSIIDPAVPPQEFTLELLTQITETEDEAYKTTIHAILAQTLPEDI